jgi:hypothetical protein
MRDRDYLFASGNLSSSIEGHRQKMQQQIHELAPNQLLPADDAAVCQHFVADFTINPVEIHDEHIVLIEPREIEIERPSDFGGTYRRKQLEFRFEIPFSGDASLLNLKPSTWSSVWPHAKVDSGRIVVLLHRADREVDAIKREFGEELSRIKQYLGWQRPDIDRWNQGLPELVRQQVAARREKLVADKKLVTDLGFKVVRRGEPTSYSVPIQRKQVIPPLPPSRPGAVAAPDPVLEATVYEEILNTLDGMSLVMERTPSAFAKMDEETLRTQFLVPLNSNFVGMASGETFNAAGKTDILIKHQDRILFIAECKFWNGPQSLTEAITQLLSYTTWRETKAAILLFSRKKDFSAVLAQIPDVFSRHPSYVRKVEYAKSTGFCFIVRSPNDPQRHLTVTLLAFNVPVES